MLLDEPLLEQVARDGEMDYSKWPALVEPIAKRINHIALKEFPLPRPYPIVNPILSSQHQSLNTDHVHDAPTTLVSQTPNTPRTLPPVPPFPGSSTSNIPDSQSPPSSPASAIENTVSTLPGELQYLLDGTIRSLQTNFAENPPHTVQRLAELILRPKKHYRYLPSWLRAVDRVVSVSSSADIFPLSDIPPLINGVNGDGGGGILWSNTGLATTEPRNSSGYDIDSLGSDESLGGALLTPIPWLKDAGHITNGRYSSSGSLNTGSDSGNSSENTNSRIEGWQSGVESGEDAGLDDMLGEPIDPATVVADAAAIAQVAEAQDSGLVPEREDGAVTQGELMRMEQEAGVVQHQRSSSPEDQQGRPEGVEMDDEGEAMPPHARGPDVVGTVDMGLVGGKEKEIRISSPPLHPEDNLIHPNDAQDILVGTSQAFVPATGGQAAKRTTSDGTSSSAENNINDGTSTTSNSDGYVDVGKDEMQVDSVKSIPSSDDGDIVLVDADGANEDNTNASRSGVNVGANTADTSTQ